MTQNRLFLYKSFVLNIFVCAFNEYNNKITYHSMQDTSFYSSNSISYFCHKSAAQNQDDEGK